MSVRTLINEKPAAAIAVAIVLIVATMGSLLYYHQSSTGGSGSGSGKAFATVDDGKTWFAHDGVNVPPFDYEGKAALGALVYEAQGKQFVGLMTRYTPQAKKAIEEARAAKAGGQVSAMLAGKAQMARDSGLEIKKPGDPTWTPWPSGQANGRPLPKIVSMDGQPATPVAK